MLNLKEFKMPNFSTFSMLLSFEQQIGQHQCKVVFSGQFAQKQCIQTIRGRMTSQCVDRSQDNET